MSVGILAAAIVPVVIFAASARLVAVVAVPVTFPTKLVAVTTPDDTIPFLAVITPIESILVTSS